MQSLCFWQQVCACTCGVAPLWMLAIITTLVGLLWHAGRRRVQSRSSCDVIPSNCRVFITPECTFVACRTAAREERQAASMKCGAHALSPCLGRAGQRRARSCACRWARCAST